MNLDISLWEALAVITILSTETVACIAIANYRKSLKDMWETVHKVQQNIVTKDKDKLE